MFKKIVVLEVILLAGQLAASGFGLHSFFFIASSIMVILKYTGLKSKLTAIIAVEIIGLVALLLKLLFFFKGMSSIISLVLTGITVVISIVAASLLDNFLVVREVQDDEIDR